MKNIHDIADYIISKAKAEDNNVSLIHLKLQKLLYYVQAWSYGIKGKPLFKGEFQAWIHGPVNKEMYDRLSPTKNIYSEITLKDRKKDDVVLNPTDSEFVDFILENYLKYSGSELEKLSHSESPWITTRGDISPYARCSNVISPESMTVYYGERWKSIKQK